MDRARLIQTLERKMTMVRGTGPWAYLAVDEWRKPFSNHPTRKGLWEQVTVPTIDCKGPCMSSTHEWLAMPQGMGNKAFLMKWSEYDEPHPQCKVLSSGSLKVSDLKFCPHNPDILAATSLTANSLRIWDLRNNMDEPVIPHTKTFLGHNGTAVHSCQWNPAVAGIMATSSKDIHLHDIEHHEEVDGSVYSVEGGAQGWISGISWDPSGHQIGYMTTKAQWGIADLRKSPKAAKTLVTSSHDRASKCQIAVLGGQGGPLPNTHVATSGYDKLGDTGREYGKQIKLWDIRNLEETVDEFTLPGGDGSAQTDLHYEPSTGLLFTVDRGGSRLHVFDVTKEDLQHIANLHETVGYQNKFYTFLDRRYVDTSYGEFMRFVCIDKENNLITERIFKESQPNLPGIRPGSMGFIPEFYPNCVGCKTRMNVNDWIQSNYKPLPLLLTNMDPKSGPECLQLDARMADGITQIEKAEWESGKLKTVHVVETDKNEKHYMHIMMENENIKRLTDLVNEAQETTDMDDVDARAVIEELRKMIQNLDDSFKNNAIDISTLMKRCEDLESRAAAKLEKAMNKRQARRDPKSDKHIRDAIADIAKAQVKESQMLLSVPTAEEERMASLEKRLERMEIASGHASRDNKHSDMILRKYEKEQKVLEGQVYHYRRKVKEKNTEILTLRKQVATLKKTRTEENNENRKCKECEGHKKRAEALAAEIAQYQLQFNEYERY